VFVCSSVAQVITVLENVTHFLGETYDFSTCWLNS